MNTTLIVVDVDGWKYQFNVSIHNNKSHNKRASEEQTKNCKLPPAFFVVLLIGDSYSS